MCNLIGCYIDMLVCFAWIVAQLLDQRPSFLAVVRHISVLNKSLSRFPLFHCQRLCEFFSCRDLLSKTLLASFELLSYIFISAFECSICQRTFKKKSGYTVHMQTHSKKKGMYSFSGLEIFYFKQFKFPLWFLPILNC